MDDTSKRTNQNYRVWYKCFYSHGPFFSFLFFRAIIQFDNYFKTILGDVLISYEFIPGTVIHLGYGTLYEKLFCNEIDNQWLKHSHPMKYYQTKQSLFFKISYIHRF